MNEIQNDTHKLTQSSVSDDQKIQEQIKEIYRLTVENNQLQTEIAKKNEEIGEKQNDLDHKVIQADEMLKLQKKQTSNWFSITDTFWGIVGGLGAYFSWNTNPPKEDS